MSNAWYIVKKDGMRMERLVYFFQSASAGGVLLLVAAIFGIIMANSGMAPYYFGFLHLEAGPLPIHLWINDVFMAIFFLLVGLEVKREMIDGELNTNAKRFLPGIGAFFGLSVPAIIYGLFNGGHGEFILGGAFRRGRVFPFLSGSCRF